MAATSDLEKQAKDAFVEEHNELAADLLTQAININPNSADLYADRAQAYIKLKLATEAIVDASRAIELDPSMSKAYLWKGLACMQLEEYVTAKAALEAGAKLAPEDLRFATSIKECEERIAEETGQLAKPVSEASPSAVPAEEVKPVSEVPSSAVSAEKVMPVSEAPSGAVSADQVKPILEAPSSAVPEQPAVPVPKPKYRHEFYQKPEEVVVTTFAKGVPADCVNIEFGEQILSVSINVPGEDAYHFQPRLFGKIEPEKSKYAVLSTKVEMRMPKAELIHWPSLEYSKEAAVVQRAIVPAVTQRPTYPSSKPGKVDWDKLEAEVKKEEKEEKLDGDAALNKFFRDIYQDADEDTRRAMRKSFVESNGTVLSTNWKEVGSKKVEGSPPDGMELKKWEY